MTALPAQAEVFLLLTEWEIWSKLFWAVEPVFLSTKWDHGFWVPCKAEWKQDVDALRPCPGRNHLQNGRAWLQ